MLSLTVILFQGSVFVANYGKPKPGPKRDHFKTFFFFLFELAAASSVLIRWASLHLYYFNSWKANQFFATMSGELLVLETEAHISSSQSLTF